MTKPAERLPNPDIHMQRQTPKVLLILFGQDRFGVSPRCLCHPAKSNRAARVFAESDAMIVIAPHNMSRPLSDETDNLRWLRPVIYKVAQNPQFVVVL
jgi:hypothetical protein